MGRSHWAALMVSALTLVGCGRGGDRPGHADTGGMMGHMDSAEMAMGGMRMEGIQMMPQMGAHMDSMMRMSPQQMQTMMARHEEMMSRMLDAMGADMRGMNMSASSAWTALTDSVKQDLAELPDLKGQELSTRMRAHAERVKRLLAMHEKMMAK